MNFLKTSFFSGINTTITLVTRLVSNKIIAVYLGANGMFLIGQLKDFIGIAKEVSCFGTSDGTIKYTASYKNDIDFLKDFLSTGFKIHLFFSAIVLILTIAFSKTLSTYLFNDKEYSNFLIVLAFTIISISIHTFFMSILNGLRKIKLYVIINVIATILSSIILIVLTIKYRIIGVFYAFAINQLITFLVSLILILYFKPFSLKLITHTFKKDKFKKLSSFSFMALAASLSLIGATLFIRNFLSKELSQDYAGAWEGMWRISGIYLMFLTTTFKFYLLPKFSTIDGKELKNEVFKIWSYIFPVVLTISIAVYILKDWIIILLFSEKFLLINTLILFHLLGDVIKINCWVLGNLLISKAKTKAFVFFQIEWAIVFTILAYFLVKYYGFSGVAIAYFFAYIIHFILQNLYLKNLLWFK